MAPAAMGSDGVSLRTLLTACAVALLAACADPGPMQPPIPTTSAGALGLRDQVSAPIAPDWWVRFGDPALGRQIERALQGHPSQALARARLARAQSLAGQHAAAYDLQSAARADLTLQRYSSNGATPAPIGGSTRATGNLMLDLNLLVGAAGQEEADLAAALGQVRAAQADSAAATTMLVGQVARHYMALARLVALLAQDQRVLAQRQQVAALRAERVSTGLDNRVELTLAEGAVSDARGQIASLDEQVVLARRLLAVWSGQAPQELADASPQLGQLALEPMPLEVGADLLARRPDVVAARWRVESAAQEVQLARTRFYPNIQLGAFAGLNAVGIGNLLRAGSLQAGIVPAIHLPLFDGGPLRAGLGARRAELDAAIAQYNAAVFEAAREAGDAIASERALQGRLAEQAHAQAAADAVLALATQRHTAGLVNYLVVLQAQTAVLAQGRLHTELRARQLDNRIVLMQALGGGWTPDAPPAGALP